MISSEPLFEFVAFWPFIRKYRAQERSKNIKADPASEAATEPIYPNLLPEETNPDPVSLPQDRTRPLSSSSSISTVSLMNPYPVALHTPIRDPSIVSHPLPLNFAGNNSFRGFPNIATPSSSPSPSRSVSGVNSFQFGIGQSFGFQSNNNPVINSGIPQSMGQLPSQPLNIGWQSLPQINPAAPLMGASRNSPVTNETNFPPLYSLPPAFWEPVVRLPERTPTPPTSAPPTPTLQQLANREDGRGENFTDDVLKAIILKAQPHHTNETIAHLTRDQLISHVDALVAWWKTANPQQAASHHPPSPQHNYRSVSVPSSMQPSQQQMVARPQSQQRSIISHPVQPPPTPVAPKPTTTEKTIGQCPCCCDATQNAAFAPCGHLYACTACAHRLYDSGRGKCPVCRVPIQTYLKIYPTS